MTSTITKQAQRAWALIQEDPAQGTAAYAELEAIANGITAAGGHLEKMDEYEMTVSYRDNCPVLSVSVDNNMRREFVFAPSPLLAAANG